MIKDDERKRRRNRTRFLKVLQIATELYVKDNWENLSNSGITQLYILEDAHAKIDEYIKKAIYLVYINRTTAVALWNGNREISEVKAIYRPYKELLTNYNVEAFNNVNTEYLDKMTVPNNIKLVDRIYDVYMNDRFDYITSYNVIDLINFELLGKDFVSGKELLGIFLGIISSYSYTGRIMKWETPDSHRDKKILADTIGVIYRFMVNGCNNTAKKLKTQSSVRFGLCYATNIAIFYHEYLTRLCYNGIPNYCWIQFIIALYELSFPYELEPEKIVNVKYIKVVYDEKDKDKYKDYDLYYFEEFSPPKDVLYSYEKFDKAMEVLWYTLNEDGIYKRKLYIEKLKRKVAHLQDNLTGKMYYKKFEFEKTPKDQKVNFIVRSKV